jgi:hypothetical protein
VTAGAAASELEPITDPKDETAVGTTASTAGDTQFPNAKPMPMKVTIIPV